MREFIKNKYNVLIPVFLLIVLLIALLLYSKEYKSNRYAEVNEVDVYQYFSGIKMEYTASVGRNKKNVILDFQNSEYDVSFDSTPVYIVANENVIFPKEMSAIFPLKNKQYYVNSLAEVYKENSLYYLNVRNLNDNYNNLFFYDGANLYFFIDNVTLEVGNRTVELSPLSYVSCSYRNFVEYYDYANDTYESIDIDNERVIVSNNYMTIDVTGDKVIYSEGFMLLTKDFSLLPKITDINE